MAQATARFAAGGGGLGELVRAAQDAASQLEAARTALPEAIARADKAAAERARADEIRLAAELDTVTARLSREFPDYAALTSPEPLSVESVQKLLAPNEALVQFLDLGAAGRLPETAFIWVITRSDARWVQLRHGRLGLRGWTTAMRCGLDASSWAEVADAPADSQMVTRRQFCTLVLGVESSQDETPPFDLVRAHELYVTLFNDVEDLIRDKHLLIVPAGALTALPFQTLVTKQPPRRLARQKGDFAGVAWLGQRNALTVLPSAASLQALRGVAKASKAAEPFLGFGNPLLSGPDGTDLTAWNKQDCAKKASAKVNVALSRRGPAFTRAATLTSVERMRAQWPLPETADELCAVAHTLGAKPAVVHLGQNATEAGVKQLSASGALAKAKVVHFATHGLIASETEMVTSTIAEAALMLTPPNTATELDDGLLTASEIAQLKLDAEWVLLSACNTASSAKSGGEDMSGLARAFFYAGARALLVSHWYVDSQATVMLISKTFAALKANPKIGRAEALRRAMSAMIAEGGGREHPAKWAPFVVVGEGGAPPTR
jgi:CHAT domain-containing protein